MVSIGIHMDQQMPYNISQDGTSIIVDVDIPATVARKQMTSKSATGEAAPAESVQSPPAEEAPSETATTSNETSMANEPKEEGNISKTEGFRKDMIMEADKLSPTA